MPRVPRSLRRWLGRLLPEVVKRPLRGRLYGFRPPRAPMRTTLHAEGDRCRVTIDDTLVLRAPATAVADLRYHLQDNGASMDEIANLLRVARGTGGLLFDVGGHKALLSQLFCLAAPGNRAVSYEPSPALRAEAAQMRAMNGLDDRLDLRAEAIGDRATRAPGYVDATGLIAFGTPPAGADALDVAFTTLDAECDRMGVHPDVVKIDIEGYEDRALAGAQRLLATHPPVLLLEFHLDLLDQRGVRARDMLAGLEGHGYTFHATDGTRLSARDVYGAPDAVIRFMARPPSAGG